MSPHLFPCEVKFYALGMRGGQLGVVPAAIPKAAQRSLEKGAVVSTAPS
jgi:hypothetical protein